MKFALFIAAVCLSWQVSFQWWEGCGHSKFEDVGEGIPDPTPQPRMIVGGIEARQGEFPWQASYRRTSSRSHFCGAVVIHPRWVLTAAHCADGETAASAYITVGEHDRNAGSNPSRRDYVLEQVFMHEMYDRNARYDADIALLRTVEEIEFNEDVQPACGPNDPMDQNVGDLATVSGWGTLSSGGSTPSVLHYTTMYVISNVLCQSALGGSTITPGMICAGFVPENERDTCQGDSGGPLAVNNNGTYEVIGLTSWGYGCASGTPGVYARVSEYYDWVTNKIESAPTM